MSPHLNAACVLLQLIVDEAEAVAEDVDVAVAEGEAMADANAAQCSEAGKERSGVYMQPHKGDPFQLRTEASRTGPGGSHWRAWSSF